MVKDLDRDPGAVNCCPKHTVLKLTICP
jgi:hypothetical protein